MARARDLEEDSALLPQRDLAVVEEARKVRPAQIFDRLVEIDLVVPFEHAQRAFPLTTRAAHQRGSSCRAPPKDTAYPHHW